MHPVSVPGDRGSPPSGIGLRAPHYQAFLEARPSVGFVEVHSENFFGRHAREVGGPARRVLERVRNDYDLSFHGIGLSLGSAEAPNRNHVDQLKRLVDAFGPVRISDHLSWVGLDGEYFNDLLPLPYTEESLAVVCENIQRVQDVLGQPLLIENPSRYLLFGHSSIPEWEFISALKARTGCGLLVDINNIYVSSINVGLDANAWLHGLQGVQIEEIHLAGFTREGDLLVDTHSRPVDPAVWALYEQALEVLGDVPALVEWDQDLPSLDKLLQEAEKADAVRETVRPGQRQRPGNPFSLQGDGGGCR